MLVSEKRSGNSCSFQSGNWWKTSCGFGSYHDFGVSTLPKFQRKIERFSCKYFVFELFPVLPNKKWNQRRTQNGKIDIVIGTHQLVGKDIEFKDLGLLIIDEEHKFGVNVKDKLKTLKSKYWYLDFNSNTNSQERFNFLWWRQEIYRWLKTPPPNRQPVDTQIIGFNEEILRDAISYEIQRDGQVYFINNRIENLKDIAGLIQSLVPDARVITGHGQMEGKELEARILDFKENMMFWFLPRL